MLEPPAFELVPRTLAAHSPAAASSSGRLWPAVGYSMRGAETILALSGKNLPPVNDSVLIAPGVWRFEATSWCQRLGRWLGARLLPVLSVSSDLGQRFGIGRPGDLAIERRLVEDPLILHHAGIDTLHGVS